MAKNITPRATNFPQWYQDVIAAGELADNSPVRGCMVIRPNGYGLWESMQEKLDRMFKETGHVNAYFPLLIPQSFITKEAEHVEGFAPELAVVTQAGGKELEEPLVIRPTSETIIGHMYAKWIQSYRDLPVLINQWCNVMRWEKRTRLFLRTSEFLWQEGHTAHETYEEAQEETLKMLGIYKEFLEDVCAIPVIPGAKPEHEKFPGAVTTYAIEAMMQDKKALQAATSHNLGQKFAKAFEIKYLGRDNQEELAWTTSWGCTTRMIGGLIMTHGDDDGIIVPPRLAPLQVVVIPIYKTEEEKLAVLDFADQVALRLRAKLSNLKVKVDYREDMRPADKFFTWIQRGIPLRVEIGPKDVQNKGGMLVRRDNRQKVFCALEGIEEKAAEILENIQADLFKKAGDFMRENIRPAETYQEFKDILAGPGGFILAHWDGTKQTAELIQSETKATIRVVPEDEKDKPGKCVRTGKPSSQRVLFAVAY
ncbi:MAG: proline--tRNA ligase [Deltaproteobacteria bacterium]|nr:proline--tRNA ligase [Deltaproteobacteria bacterium]